MVVDCHGFEIIGYEFALQARAVVRALEMAGLERYARGSRRRWCVLITGSPSCIGAFDRRAGISTLTAVYDSVYAGPKWAN